MLDGALNNLHDGGRGGALQSQEQV